MTNAAERDDEQTVEVPLADIRRLIVRVERLANDVERLLNRKEHAARRAANLAGPTTDEARARVARKLEKWGAK